MTSATPAVSTTAGPLSSLPPGGADGGVALRSRLAGGALVLVLLAVSVFAVWSAEATSQASTRAVMASGLSDDYAEAANAVGGEESLERKYRLEPGPDVQAKYDKVAASFVAALGRVRRDGDTGDRAFVDATLAQHYDYLKAIDRLFRATDRGDTTAALKIDRGEVDPSFGAIDQAVLGAAKTQHGVALAQLAWLQHLESTTRTLTPLVFLAGLGLAALLASVTRGHRRQLAAERSQALHDSLHDALTGLPNRTLLADRFDQSLRADTRAGTATGLLLIDLDRFKEINDTFGHHYGDELLRRSGRAWRARCARSTRSRGSAATSSLSCSRTSTRSTTRSRSLASSGARSSSRSESKASTLTSRPASASSGPASTARTRRSCCSVPTSRCTWPRPSSSGCSPTTQPSTGTPQPSSPCSGTCAAHWSAANSSCTTNPRSAPAPATSSAPRPWSAGSTPTEA